MKPLVFIHGILLGGWVFTRMQKVFAQWGYDCFRFNYPSHSKTIQQNARYLAQWLNRKGLQNADFICHSMGGMVCQVYFSKYADRGDSTIKVVCLGSPFKGSMVARSLSRFRAGRYLLGVQSNTELITGLAPWPDWPAMGVIAGNRSLGAGMLLGIDVSRVSDGTVLVEETGNQGAIDHIILPVSHSQMTFSSRVFYQSKHFLIHSKFEHH